jgi:hypothetical protein
VESTNTDIHTATSAASSILASSIDVFWRGVAMQMCGNQNGLLVCSGVTSGVQSGVGSGSFSGSSGVSSGNGNTSGTSGISSGSGNQSGSGVLSGSGSNNGGGGSGGGGSTGLIFPGTATNASGFTNPNNVKATDGVYAFTSSGTIKVTNFNFGALIPAGATIVGITVDVVKRGTVNFDSVDTTVQLTKDGSTGVGANKASGTTWNPTTFTTSTYGSSSDLWSTTLSYSDVTASTFGLIFSCTCIDGSCLIDSISINVTYTT